jgi:hypothetical protein
MLVARDGGCTKPGCMVGAYGCQVHHALADWIDGGNTNVDEMALACGPDNRMVDGDGGYTTTINDRGEVEWIPPPHLDTGQARTNYYHRPEALMRPPDAPKALQHNVEHRNDEHCDEHRNDEHDGWTTPRGKDDRAEPIPPPHPNTRPARTTTDDHPERMLMRTDPDADAEHNGDAA